MLPPKGTRGQGCSFIRFNLPEDAEKARSSLNDTYVTYESHPDHKDTISVHFQKQGGGGAKGGGAKGGGAKGGAPGGAAPYWGNSHEGYSAQQYAPQHGGSTTPYGAPYGNSQPQQYSTSVPVDESKLFIGSLPIGITTEEIKGIFAKHGTIEDVHILPPKGERGQGCAFVKFNSNEQAAAAISALHDQPTAYPSFPEYKTPILVRISHGGVKRQRTW